MHDMFPAETYLFSAATTSKNTDHNEQKLWSQWVKIVVTKMKVINYARSNTIVFWALKWAFLVRFSSYHKFLCLWKNYSILQSLRTVFELFLKPRYPRFKTWYAFTNGKCTEKIGSFPRNSLAPSFSTFSSTIPVVEPVCSVTFTLCELSTLIINRKLERDKWPDQSRDRNRAGNAVGTRTF